MRRLSRLLRFPLALGLFLACGWFAAAADASPAQIATGDLTARVFLLRLTAPPEKAPPVAQLALEGVSADAEFGELIEALQRANPAFRIELMELVEAPLVVGQPFAIRRSGPGSMFLDATIERLATDPDPGFAAKAGSQGGAYIPLHVVQRFEPALPVQYILNSVVRGGGTSGNTIQRIRPGECEQLATPMFGREWWSARGRWGEAVEGTRAPDPVVTCVVALSRRPVPIRPYEPGGPQVADAFPQPQEPFWVRRVTMEFRDTPVRDAIKMLAGELGRPVVFHEEPPKAGVTMTLRDVDPEEAIKMLCDAEGLACTVDANGVVVSAAPTVSVGGSKVPLLGALSLPSTLPGTTIFQALASHGTRATFPGGDKLVDLEVKDALIREAMAKLSQATGIEIVVHEAVPKEIKLTARMFQMPLGQVLSLIVDQANLTYTVSAVPGPDAKKQFDAGLITERDYLQRHDVPTIHIVPKPELKVTGPGLPPAKETSSPYALPGTYVPQATAPRTVVP